MDVKEAIRLISGAGAHFSKVSTWADLGCGDGLFTRALASLLPAGSTVYAVDTHPAITNSKVNDVSIIPMQADFVQTELAIRKLDGILMANALHYVSDKQSFLRKMLPHFAQKPFFLIVEYDTDKPVPRWVPYPVSFATLQKLWNADVTRLAEYPSRFGGKMYAAMVELR